MYKYLFAEVYCGKHGQTKRLKNDKDQNITMSKNRKQHYFFLVYLCDDVILTEEVCERSLFVYWNSVFAMMSGDDITQSGILH